MKITFDATPMRALASGLKGFSERRVQSTVAEALNKTARAVADGWGGQLLNRIDRPTPLTRGAARVLRADVGRLQAQISLKDVVAQRGLPPSVYLAPLEQGGGRTVKKFERALQNGGAMPMGSMVVPAKYAKLDGFGNISRGQIVQVLNQLGSGLSSGYQRVIGASAAVRAQSAAAKGRTYIALTTKRGGLAAGVYEKLPTGLFLPVFFFVTHTHYRRQLNLLSEAASVVRVRLAGELSAAFEKRLQSLRNRQASQAVGAQ